MMIGRSIFLKVNSFGVMGGLVFCMCFRLTGMCDVCITNLGSLSGMGGEVCEVTRKRLIAVCCLLEVRWSGQNEWDGGKEI